MTDKYEKISNYMVQNKLVLNSDKSHLLVLTSSQRHKKHQNFGISLSLGEDIIEPKSHEKLLGAFISNDFKWNQHIHDNDKSMLRILTSKVNALGKISKVANFKNRKMIASGLIISTLNYVIQVYGCCSDYLLTFLQVLQNKAARHVTRLPWRTSTSTLLNQCGWLSVRQLVRFHSLVLLYKIKTEKSPKYLYDQLSKEYPNTRLSAGGALLGRKKVRTGTAKRSFLPRTIEDWNGLPNQLRESPNLRVFKLKLKKWIKDNVPIK